MALSLEAIALPGLLVDPEGTVREVNRLDAAMFAGVPSGMPLSAVLAETPDLSRPTRVHARRLNRVPFAADLFPSRLEDGCVLCLFHEIRGERLIAESQRFLEVSFDIAPIGMAIFDTNGCYVRVNGALCQLLDRTADELIGRRDQELTHPEDRQSDLDAAWRILEGEIDWHQTEKRFMRPDGSIVWAIANLTFLRDEDGRPLCWIGQFQDITARKNQERQLEYLADHDALTGVANRRRLFRELESRLGLARRYGTPSAVLLLDLDGFKEINDTQGHDAGDAVLIEVARALDARLRSTDMLARLGGDEFAVVLPEVDGDQAHEIAGALLVAVRATGLVRASCGIAVVEPLATAEQLLGRADRALYAAKAEGRDRAVAAPQP